MSTNEKNGGFRIMVAAPASGSGKTAVSCGLLALMRKRGQRVCGFKCGPDYIDPMFHRSVLGVKSRNLDVFLAGEEGVIENYKAECRDMDAVICEGVMGYYDGIRVIDEDSGDAKASPWHIATMLNIPSVLVMRPKGAALTLAAVIRGLANFRSPSNIAGVIFNDCSSTFFDSYGKMISEESGVPVLGYLPHMEEAEFSSRHLGLMTASEIRDIEGRIERIADTMEKTVDIDELIALCSSFGDTFDDHGRYGDPEGKTMPGSLSASDTEKARGVEDREKKIPTGARIAVARDEAFCFIYEESLDALRDAGAELCFFSPMRDRKLPDDTGGLYLPGGYPELYGEQLARNGSMRRQIRDMVSSGLPTIAECGGFLYLGGELRDIKGQVWPMVGVFSGRAENSGGLVRFGYGHVASEYDSMLFRKGEMIPVHEFHYWDTSENGSDMELIKARDGSRSRFGFCTDKMYAGFPHLYLAGYPVGGKGKKSTLAERFLEAACSSS